MELETVGGIIHSLATNLLSSFNLVDSGKFRLSSFVKLLSNLSFIQKFLVASPVVIQQLSSDYEIPFT